MRRTVILRGSALVLAVAAICIVTVTARAAQLVTVTIPSQGLIASKWYSYSGPPRANILLPTGYNPKKAYPVLYLLSGLMNDYNSYAELADPQQLFAKLGAIVVMPEGANGWYADWWNNGQRGDPSWESYELDVVIPWVQSHYKIRSGRRWHAIAGVSMGGLGAVYLAGRLPGYFGTVATLSGFVDPGQFNDLAAEGEPLVSEAPFNGDPDWEAVTGPPSGFYAIGHNPPDLVDNLRDTRIFQSTGTGTPTGAELSSPTSGLEGAVLESQIIYPMNISYNEALAAAGIPETFEVHYGGHDIPNFLGELHAMLAWGVFKPIVSDPASWTNQTVATHGQLWDISYTFAKPPTAVVTFTQVGRRLTVSAAGAPVAIATSKGCTLTVATPADVRLPATRCGPAPKRGR